MGKGLPVLAKWKMTHIQVLQRDLSQSYQCKLSGLGSPVFPVAVQRAEHLGGWHASEGVLRNALTKHC